ncbi:hypothetical protein HQ585_20160 [candidate division KSB1 bacterium]|nr:hypothetical protein [candidate division KSB1 bacterium]
MMKRKLLIIISLLLIKQAIAQYYTPQSLILIPKSGLDKSSIVQTLNSERVLFTPVDIDELRLAIRKSNNSVENEISLIKSKMSNLFMDKQELLQLKDIKKINEVIAEKRRNKKEIESQVQSDLSSINYKGLFIVVQKDIDPWASKQQLADVSEKALTPKAVEDLNGIFISSLTTIESSQLISDKIIATISGEMSVESQYISRTIDNRTKFLYLVKINVTPLKKTIKTSSAETAASETHLILNAMTERNYESKLQGLGVSQDEIIKVSFEVQSSRESIRLANATAERRQADILRNGNANITKVDDEIKTLENSLINRSGTLKNIIEEKTNVVYDAGNPDKSIDKALSYLDSELDALKNQLIATKERELIPRYSVSVTTEGTPAEDIAKTAVDIAGQIEQSYSKIEQFMEETTIDNFMLTDYSRGQQKDVYRKLESVWLYPVAGDRDNFLLTVVVKFKVADIKEHKAESIPRKKVIDAPNTMTDIDGNVYKTVKIGNQVWMAENLKVTHYRNGDPIPNITDNSQWAKLTTGSYGAYNNKEMHAITYGYLYNGYAVKDRRNIAPKGWHVPTKDEWQILIDYLGGLYITGGKLKETGTAHWRSPNNGATNESGFSALPGGDRDFENGRSYSLGINAWFWSFTSNRSNLSMQQLDVADSRIISSGTYDEHFGFSIRLVKDTEQASKPVSKHSYGTLKDIDENIYKTVKIGNQVWMAENLRVAHYRNGDQIPYVVNNSEWFKLNSGAFCTYENSGGAENTYGHLYNWHVVNDNRNIAPMGWHVPDNNEWRELIKYLGSSDVAGGKLKTLGLTYWKAPNTDATNESGFSALPAGCRMREGNFDYRGGYTFFWSRTVYDDFNARYWFLGCNYSIIYGEGEYREKNYGCSIRLVKD